MKKVAIYTLGCKINQYESNLILQNLIKEGYDIVDFKEKADVYIINTCTVTSQADRKSRQMARQAKKRNPASKVIVTGCCSNLNPEKFEDFSVFKNKLEIVKELTGKDVKQKILSTSFGKSRFFIKIQDGCNKFCAYCRIPYARGAELKSKNIKLVLQEIENAIENGYSEIVLSGINIGLYGKDLGTDLLSLLEAIEDKNFNARFRISSIDPKDAYNLISFLSLSRSFVHHLHISLQSGSDRILKLMNRDYSKNFFIRLLFKLREIDPLYSVSTDVIVGFPTEDENSINDTVDLMNRFEFSRIHIFPYSNRPETLAFKMKNQVSQRDIKNYLKIIRKAAEDSKQRYKNMLNGCKDFGINENDGHILGQYYVDTLTTKPILTCKEFTYKLVNDVLYAEQN